MSWQDELLSALTDFSTVATLAKASVAIGVEQVEFLPAPHTQPKHQPQGMMAVYGFWWDGSWLKIGKVGANSGARYTSHHYNRGSTRSNLALSLARDPAMRLVTGFDVKEPGGWIRTNTSRMNIFVPEVVGLQMLALPEAFLHVRLHPKYEGRNQSGE
jgi:hypothetical protein